MKKQKNNWIGLLLPVLLLTGWILFTAGEESYALPTPKRLILTIYDFATGRLELTSYSGEMFMHLWKSTGRVLRGFALASVLGITAGFLTGRIPVLKKAVDPFVQAVRAIPGIGFLPISIVWFGVGDKNTLFLITLAAFFPVYLNTQEGAAEIPQDYIRSGYMLGAKGITLFRTVIFPAAFPQIFIGLRLALGVSWAYLVLGEMTGVTRGIGAVMMNGRMLGNVEIVMTGMAVIAVAGKLTDYILVKLYQCIYIRRGRLWKKV